MRKDLEDMKVGSTTAREDTTAKRERKGTKVIGNMDG